MTFGRESSLTHNQRQESVPAMEQIFATAWPGAFASTEKADVVVAERKQDHLSLSPLYPEDHEFGRDYPSRKTSPLVHRRMLALVKHEPESPFEDYLVVRDETQTTEAQAVNIHLQARGAVQKGNLILADGQWDMDMAVYVAEATDLTVEHRAWWYSDIWMLTPGEEYELRAGESLTAWTTRLDALKREHGVDSLPLPGWKPQWKAGRDASNPYLDRIAESEGRALIPPPGWTDTWMYGEYQHWLRLNTAPGTPVLWVLYPYPKGSEPPTFESIANGTGVRITHKGKSEEVFLATDPDSSVLGQAVLRRNGKNQVLLGPDAVPELGAIQKRPLP
jgi:hypothetical protein